MPRRRSKSRRRKTHVRHRKVSRSRARAAYHRNLKRLATRARTRGECADASTAIIGHCQSGDISKSYANKLLGLVRC